MVPSDNELLQQIAGLDGADDLGGALAELGRPELHAVVAGEFNSGKSTLLNAILGRRLLLSSAVPTTGKITRVCYGGDEHIIVRDPTGIETKHPISHLERVTTLDGSGTTSAEVDLVTAVCNSRVLYPITVLVDTPGTNDDTVQTRQALAALGTADVIIWVIRADAALKTGERALADEWLALNPGALLIPVVNFMNFVPKREAAAVARRLDALLDQKCGARVSWLKAIIDRPYFQIDAQRALEWSAEGIGEPEGDFTALLDFLGRLKGAAGADVTARSRPGWVGPRIERAKASNAQHLARLRVEAAGARESREAQHRKRDSDLRHFEARAEAGLAVIQKESQKHLAESQERLVTVWLSNESVSSLREKTDRWGRSRLEEAAAKIAEGANISRKALAAEFDVPAKGDGLAVQSLPLRFSVTLPTSGLVDDFWDLFDTPPTDEFMSKTRAVVRREWENRAQQVLKAVSSVWDRWVKEMRAVLEGRFSSESAPGPDGWYWAVTDELVKVKARELKLRRPEDSKPVGMVVGTRAFSGEMFGRPVSTTSKSQSRVPGAGDYELRDLEKARELLNVRVKAGEPLRKEVLEREAAAAAFEELAARYVGKSTPTDYHECHDQCEGSDHA